LEAATARAAELESIDREPKPGSEDSDPAAQSALRSEVDRLTGELAIAIERRQTAEERLATMTAELIAAQRAESAGRSGASNGNGMGSNTSGEKMPWTSSPSREREATSVDAYDGGASGPTAQAERPVGSEEGDDDANAPAAQAEVRPVGPGKGDGDADPADTAPPIDEGADDIASLRSRLARTAAKKKSRASMDRPRSS
jgi:hypothetical protein